MLTTLSLSLSLSLLLFVLSLSLPLSPLSHRSPLSHLSALSTLLSLSLSLSHPLLSLSLSVSLSLLSPLFISLSLSLSLSCAGWSIIEQSFIKSRSVFHRACLFEYTLRCASLWTESPGSLFDLPHTATGDSTAAHRTLSITQPQHKTCYVLWQFHTHWPALNIHPDPILHISQGPDHHTTTLHPIQNMFPRGSPYAADLQCTHFLPLFL